MRARSASGSVDSPSAVEPDEVAEEDGDDLARLASGLGRGQWRSTGHAETCLGGFSTPQLGQAVTRGVYEGRAARRSFSTARERSAETTFPFCS